MSRPGIPGPERFRKAGSYQVAREWRRYEGTPQRELLRRVREQFLERGLGTLGGDHRPRLEIGPGPGRFSPQLARFAGTLLLADASRAMLLEARRTMAQMRVPRSSSSPIQADARWLPARKGTFSAVTVLGNVVGFAGRDAVRLLREATDAVAPGGILVLETFAPVTAIPKTLCQLSTRDWARLLEEDHALALGRLLEGGFRTLPGNPGREGKTSQFRFLSGSVLESEMIRSGLDRTDQLVAAPLSGGDPDLVARIAKLGVGYAAQLLKMENRAGRDPRIVVHGGHLLTCWKRAIGVFPPP